MSTISLPPIVNDQGNINVHKDEGAVIPIVVQNDEGVEIDATGTPLFFISGTFRKALDPDPDNPEGRMVILTSDDLDSITHGAQFRVVDESSSSFPVIKWEGRLYKRG